MNELKDDPRFYLVSSIHSLKDAKHFIAQSEEPVILILDETSIWFEWADLEEMAKNTMPYLIAMTDTDPTSALCGQSDQIIMMPQILDPSTMRILCHNIITKIKLYYTHTKDSKHTLEKKENTFDKNLIHDTLHYKVNNKNEQVILLAASTGGTEALTRIFENLPNTLPPICIVQHMPKDFTFNFANRLNAISDIEVSEVATSTWLEWGKAYIAPGDLHLRLRSMGDFVQAICFFDEKLHGVRPAADILFKSAGDIFADRTISVVLTGMGNDGAAGMKYLKELGGITIAQNKATSTVFGMPKAAIEKEAAHFVLPLQDIPQKIIQSSMKR